MAIFDVGQEEIVDGLEKSEAALALVHGFLFYAKDDPDVYELNHEAFSGAAATVCEVRYALRDMVRLLRERTKTAKVGRKENTGGAAQTDA
ncbi:MAG: hypothetical protein WAN11_17795 [Syntrophobacteraceae bacterium]